MLEAIEFGKFRIPLVSECTLGNLRLVIPRDTTATISFTQSATEDGAQVTVVVENDDSNLECTFDTLVDESFFPDRELLSIVIIESEELEGVVQFCLRSSGWPQDPTGPSIHVHDDDVALLFDFKEVEPEEEAESDTDARVLRDLSRTGLGPKKPH